MSSSKMTRLNNVQARKGETMKVDTRLAMRQCLLLPSSKFRLWWDAVACALIFFIATVLPYRTAFVIDWSIGWTVVDFIIDIFFLIDILINCRTMIVIDGTLSRNSHAKLIGLSIGPSLSPPRALTTRRASPRRLERSQESSSRVPAESFLATPRDGSHST